MEARDESEFCSVAFYAGWMQALGKVRCLLLGNALEMNLDMILGIIISG